MTLFLDLDGPVLDVSRRYHAVHLELAGENGVVDRELYWRLRRSGRSETELLGAGGARERAARALRLEAPEHLALDEAWPEVRDALRHGSRHGKVVAVTFRRREAPLREQLADLGLLEHFDGLVVRGDSEVDSKAHLIREAGWSWTSDDWFCGDTELEVLAAREMGIRCCAVTFGLFDRSRLEPLEPEILVDEPSRLAEWMVCP